MTVNHLLFPILRMMTDLRELMITCVEVEDFLHTSWAGPYDWKHRKMKPVNKVKIVELCQLRMMIVDFLGLFMMAMHLVMLGSQVHLSLNLARYTRLKSSMIKHPSK